MLGDIERWRIKMLIYATRAQAVFLYALSDMVDGDYSAPVRYANALIEEAKKIKAANCGLQAEEHVYQNPLLHRKFSRIT